MPATVADIIKWQLKCLIENALEMTDSELTLITSFEEQFIRKGTLSKRQMEILEDIYRRRS